MKTDHYKITQEVKHTVTHRERFTENGRGSGIGWTPNGGCVGWTTNGGLGAARGC